MPFLVSIIIPAYNAGDFIQDTIESALRQTYYPIEIVVIDDGSQDDTINIALNYKEKVKVICQKNYGPAAARNKGIQESQGDFIAFLDADDIWTQDKIQSQVNILENNLDIGLLCSDMIDFEGSKIDQLSHFKKNKLNQEYFQHKLLVKDAFRKIFYRNFVSTPTVLMRKALVNKIGFFPEEFRYAEDYLYWLRAARHAHIGYQSSIFVYRRRHRFNLTNDPGFQVKHRVAILDRIVLEHGDILYEHGIDIEKRYAELWFQLGYFELFQNKNPQVSSAFANSLRHRLHWRTVFYLFVSMLGFGQVMIRLKEFRDSVMKKYFK